MIPLSENTFGIRYNTVSSCHLPHPDPTSYDKEAPSSRGSLEAGQYILCRVKVRFTYEIRHSGW
jgi:hypothetical protein